MYMVKNLKVMLIIIVFPQNICSFSNALGPVCWESNNEYGNIFYSQSRGEKR